MLPQPRAGLVIRYSYLWTEEGERGQEHGRKDRPCAIVVAVQRSDSSTIVRVLPITHSRPADPESGLEIPPLTKQRLGLDAHRSWIILDDANDFTWPGPDLRPIRAGDTSTVEYGMLPPAFISILRAKFKARYRLARTRSIRRSE